MNKIYEKGDTVFIDGRKGTVQYVRFAPPDYSQPLVYSVYMEDMNYRPNYGGSVWPAERVKES